MVEGRARSPAQAPGAALRLAAIAALLAAAAALLPGCAAMKLEKQREDDLAELLRWLPGTYVDTAQADSDARQGIRPPHDRVQLAIVNIPAPRLGHHAYYVQEMAADDPQRVMSERFWSFKIDDDKGIVQTIYTPKEPVRWRDGQNTPDLFTGITVEDVETTPGCELLWKKVDQQFVASDDTKKCHVPGVAGVDMKFQLTVDSLNIADTETDVSGRVVRGGFYDPYTRFRKTK
jgi:CpeT/CpcT family (DUF1001)